MIVALCTVFFSSISISLLSMHTNRLLKEGRDASNNLINAVSKDIYPNCFCYYNHIRFVLDQISRILAPSYEGAQLQDLSSYIRIIAIVFVFSCYYQIINVVLETDKRFLPGKGQAFFQNLFVICFCIAVLS